MASNYSTNLKLELIATGEQAGTWGTTTNTNLGTALEESIVGYGNPDFTSDADLTLTLTNSNATQIARNLVLNVTSSVPLSATRNLVVPTIEKPYVVQNNTTGGQSIVVKTSGGTGITIPNGKSALVYADGTNVVSQVDHIPSLTLGSALPVASGGTGATSLTANNVILGNGTSAVQAVAPGVDGNFLVSNGTTWTTESGSTARTSLGLGSIATQNSNSVSITGGTINGTTIGATTAAAGTFTSLDATGATTLSQNPTLSAGYTYGIVHLDSSKTAISTSNLTFTGDDLLTVDGIYIWRGGSGIVTNTAIGTYSLQVNTTGSYNVALGYYALNDNTTGLGNVAVGTSALIRNTTGLELTGIGKNALRLNTTGIYNTALGNNALYGNSTGNNNVAVGNDSLLSSTGSDNTAVGFQAGYSNTTGAVDAFGYQTGFSNTTGSRNVAIGRRTLYSNTTGNYNTAVGYSSLFNHNGYHNNTAVGYETLAASTSGTANTAIGYKASTATTTGNYNTSLGSQALFSNTTASNNTAVGYQAGYTLTTAPNNILIGYQAGYSKTTGNSEVLIGYQAGYGITTGADNVCIGNQAGYYITATTTGSANIYIGSACRGSGAANTREIAIGFDTSGKGSNTGFINPNGGGVYQGNNSSSWSTTSDQRLKKNIVDNTEGLEKIAAIQVRNFEYRLPEEITELDPSNAVDITGVQLGVIAQELQQVCPDCVKEESTGVLSVDSDNVFWHMVNAIKELKTELDTVKAELATLKGN